jgi:hypothetical protein
MISMKSAEKMEREGEPRLSLEPIDDIAYQQYACVCYQKNALSKG